MIKIKPDREGLLTQWDLNRRIQITGLEDISNTEIHFSKPDDTKGAYVVLPVIENGIAFADIPNILLTVSGRIDVFVYRDDHTCVRGVFVVAPREKPDDYIYEETEVLKYEDFVERLDGLETQKEDKANIVTTVDDNSDDEHYPTAKAVYKAIPKSLKNPYSLTFTGAVTGSYDGSKPMTFNIPVGGSGTDISLGLTGASVGDIIKVKQVDADGKPTAWEAAGMHSAFVKDAEMTVVDGATNALLSLNGTYNKVLVRVNTDNSEALTTDAKSMYCGFDGETTYAGSASRFTKGNSFWFLGVYIGDGIYLMFEWVGNHFYTSSSVVCVPLGITDANGLTTFKINQYGSYVDLTGITITAYREEII